MDWEKRNPKGPIVSPKVMNAYSELLRDTLQYLLDCQLANGNYPTRAGNKEAHLVQFCHGAPAFCLLYSNCLQRKLLEDIDLKLSKANEEAGKLVYKEGLLTKGNGLCHGIPGNAFVFLKLYSLTKEREWLKKAERFLWFSRENFEQLFEIPDRPCSLYEGISGLLVFLHNFVQVRNDSSFVPSFPAFDL